MNKQMLFFLILLMSLVFLLISKYNHDANLLMEEKSLHEKHNIIYNAKIIKFETHFNRKIDSGIYSYIINGNKYSQRINTKLFCKPLSSFQKAKVRQSNFHVIYLEGDPNISRILLNRKDFEKFNEPYPDSLAHILDKYFECDE